MAIIRSREALVSARTQLVNHVRGTVKSFGGRLPKGPASGFHKKAAAHIPEALWPALEPILETIGSLTQRIGDYDRQLEEISKAHYPETDLLRQVEGVGTLTALTFVLTVENLPLRKEPQRRRLSGACARQRSVGRQKTLKGVSPRKAMRADARLVEHLLQRGPYRDLSGSCCDGQLLEPLDRWVGPGAGAHRLDARTTGLSRRNRCTFGPTREMRSWQRLLPVNRVGADTLRHPFFLPYLPNGVEEGVFSEVTEWNALLRTA